MFRRIVSQAFWLPHLMVMVSGEVLELLRLPLPLVTLMIPEFVMLKVVLPVAPATVP